MGIYYGVPEDLILQGISNYIPNMNRSQWIQTIDHKNILLDAYNANPSSMSAGIKSFSTLEGAKTLLLGDMLELGEHSEIEHQKIFEQIQALGFTEVYLVGDEFKKAVPPILLFLTAPIHF